VKKGRAGAGIIKFKDDAGNAWSGFGPKPRWLTEALAAGKTIEELKVQ
jgi:DNA-binding protein H-NS